MNKIINLLKLLFRAGKYRWMEDRDEFNFMLSSIKKDDVVFDIGAHKGAYTFWMKNAIGRNGKLVAFEPQQKGFLLLKSIFPQKNVKVENLAVSDSEESASFYVQDQPHDVSYEASLQNKYENYQQIFVRTITIDRYCSKENLVPNFIKIDVEGHEEHVLKGAHYTLSTHRPFLLIEAEVRHIGEASLKKIFTMLLGMGYKGYFFTNKKMVEIANFSATLHQDVNNISKGNYSNNFAFIPGSLNS